MKRVASGTIGAAVLLLSVCSCGPSLSVGKALELPPETAKLKPSSLAGYTIAAQKCGICHSADYISYQPPGMSKAQWTGEVQKMQRIYGAPLDDNEIQLLGIYLAATYGDAATVTAEDRTLTVPASGSRSDW
jgi:cytochrome c